jgi:Flp pilus assembly pilin Flp
VAKQSSAFAYIAKNEAGQTMAEYAVILSAVSVTVILAIAALADSIGFRFSEVTSLIVP